MTPELSDVLVSVANLNMQLGPSLYIITGLIYDENDDTFTWVIVHVDDYLTNNDYLND